MKFLSIRVWNFARRFFSLIGLLAFCKSSAENKFLGWKVQLLKDFSKSEDLESPFWDISSVESNAIEKKILQFGLFSTDDHQNANTPLREIKRRTEFQAQIDELFN